MIHGHINRLKVGFQLNCFKSFRKADAIVKKWNHRDWNGLRKESFDAVSSTIL